jgi:transposase, IS5 family
MLPDLLHGEERKVWGDGGYQGQGALIRQAAPRAQDMTSRRVQYKNFVDQLQKAKNRVKARVRAQVEHPFRILKRIFSFEKVRYSKIKKQADRQRKSGRIFYLPDGFSDRLPNVNGAVLRGPQVSKALH